MPAGASSVGRFVFSTVATKRDGAGIASPGGFAVLAEGSGWLAGSLERIVRAATTTATATIATATHVHWNRRRRDQAALPCVACRLAFRDRLLSLRARSLIT
jgi:hypothetical protein